MVHGGTKDDPADPAETIYSNLGHFDFLLVFIEADTGPLAVR